MENLDNFRPTFSAHNCCVDCVQQVDNCTKPEYRCSAFGCDKSRPCRPCPDFQPKDEKR